MEDIVILKKLEFFRGLNTLELAKINAVTHRATFLPGEIVVKEGTRGGPMYIIKKGSVTVSKEGNILARLGSGDPIGEIAFIDKGPRSATVKAEEDTVLIEIPDDAFDEVLARNKDIAYKVYRAVTSILCERLRDANELLKKENVLLLASTG
jgi:CRP/FNR family cyclic AMP-dependent transcriptional regulator